MKKISNETLSQVTGGKFWGSRVECRVQANGHCMCRKVYYRFGIRSYGGCGRQIPASVNNVN